MAQATNYQQAGQLSNIEPKFLDSTERQLAAAQVAATLAVADQVYDLVHQIERLAVALEGTREELPTRIGDGFEALRQQIRTGANL